MSWVVAWLGSAQGPYPCGNDTYQPDLSGAFPYPKEGARDQSFRLIIRPAIWGKAVRLRFSNVWGSRSVTFTDVVVAKRAGGASLQPATVQHVTFDSRREVVVPVGQECWSDAISVGWSCADGEDAVVGFHVHGASGPMTWHAKALTTSYLTAPGVKSCPVEVSECAYRFSTTSWFFLDALETEMRAGSFAAVALGDSITEGTGSTLNGHDRWTDILNRRLWVKHPNRIAIVNAGIGGNQIRHPRHYDPRAPFVGGPSGCSRLDRDVLSLAGVRALIWTQGINDFSRNGNARVEEVAEAVATAIATLRSRRPELKIFGGTLPPALGSRHPAHGFAEEDAERRAWNAMLRGGAIFDRIIDFDAALVDPATGQMREEYCPSSMGGPGDMLHPNRLGYMTMAEVAESSLAGHL